MIAQYGAVGATGKNENRIKCLDFTNYRQRGKQELNMTASLRERMEIKLKAAYAPEFLQVIDESHKHAGHIVHEGDAPHGGETHFRIQIVAPAFAGKGRIERHRAINALFSEEFSAGLHALALDIRAPGD
jgi:BolA protein